MLYLANFISVLPLYYIICIIIITCYNLILNLKIWKSILYYFCGLIFALLSPELIKNIITYINPNSLLWYRPDGAKGCDFQSIKGLENPFTSGFPSGHMTLTSYVMIFNILILIKKNFNNNKLLIIILILLNLSFILIMAWARYYKKCHNIFQIIGGIFLGWIISLIALKYF